MDPSYSQLQNSVSVHPNRFKLGKLEENDPIEVPSGCFLPGIVQKFRRKKYWPCRAILLSRKISEYSQEGSIHWRPQSDHFPSVYQVWINLVGHPLSSKAGNPKFLGLFLNTRKNRFPITQFEKKNHFHLSLA